MIGIVGFSFALTKNEPNPCNLRLAEEVSRILREELNKGNNVVVVVQWEIAKALEIFELKPDHVVKPKKGVYLDSDILMKEATEVFLQRGITKVIPVANPFLHLSHCRKLVQKSGFILADRKVKRIGFCKESLQWWTRSPFNLILYGIHIKLFGKGGRNRFYP